MYRNGKLIDRREMLKIKLASLVQECAIIRRAEARQKAYNTRGLVLDPILLHELIHHRRGPVRKEARLTGIAIAMIRGKKLETLELKHKSDNLLTEADWNAITRMVAGYGSKEAVAHVANERARYARWIADEKALRLIVTY